MLHALQWCNLTAFNNLLISVSSIADIRPKPVKRCVDGSRETVHPPPPSYPLASSFLPKREIFVDVDNSLLDGFCLFGISNSTQENWDEPIKLKTILFNVWSVNNKGKGGGERIEEARCGEGRVYQYAKDLLMSSSLLTYTVFPVISALGALEIQM